MSTGGRRIGNIAMQEATALRPQRTASTPRVAAALRVAGGKGRGSARRPRGRRAATPGRADGTIQKREAWRAARQVLDVVGESVALFDEVNVATALHRLAKLQPPGTSGPQSPIVYADQFQALVEAVQRLLDRFEAQAISNTLWGARGPRPPPPPPAPPPPPPPPPARPAQPAAGRPGGAAGPPLGAAAGAGRPVQRLFMRRAARASHCAAPRMPACNAAAPAGRQAVLATRILQVRATSAGSSTAHRAGFKRAARLTQRAPGAAQRSPRWRTTRRAICSTAWRTTRHRSCARSGRRPPRTACGRSPSWPTCPASPSCSRLRRRRGARSLLPGCGSARASCSFVIVSYG